MKVKEFMNEVETSYSKYFTDSKCEVELGSLYKGLYVKCYLVNNLDEVANRIIQNDMFSIYFGIDADGSEFDKDINLESELPQNLQLKVIDKSYLIKPQQNYLCYSSRKLSFRKTIGDADKIVATLDKYFKKLHDELVNDIKNDYIHEHHIDLLKSKII